MRQEKKRMEITFPFICWESDTVSFPLHRHDCFEMLVVSKGGMYVSLNDVLYEASAGDLVMINSGAVHGFFDQQPGTMYSGFQWGITLFDESFINLRDTLFSNPIAGKNIQKETARVRLRRLVSEIVIENTEREMGYQLAIKSKLYELMLIILREAPRQYSKMLPSKSRQMLEFVLKNIDDPDFTLGSAADSLQLNKFYFSHLFKKHIGQSFHSYLIKTRLTFAKHYLIESKMPITDVAFQSGFNSIQTFNRVFKSMTGFTPKDYRYENSVLAADFGPVFHKRNTKKEQELRKPDNYW